jgi:hypothetical protein
MKKWFSREVGDNGDGSRESQSPPVVAAKVGGCSWMAGMFISSCENRKLSSH